MLGFTAEYAGGEVRFADEELTSGGFFTADNLPPLPGPPSIARQLIDNWLEELL
jgi:NAD+ diphosphatase